MGLKETLIHNLKRLRQDKRLTQGALGERAGLPGNAISRWEIGQGWPTAQNIELLAEGLGVTTDELLTIGKNDKITVKQALELINDSLGFTVTGTRKTTIMIPENLKHLSSKTIEYLSKIETDTQEFALRGALRGIIDGSKEEEEDQSDAI